ncbi:MAG: type II toxin-antitoxin system RelE/ParE family toxin [Bryobacteraceae bacterium]|jgi:plasmid stabilization system protein ParE
MAYLVSITPRAERDLAQLYEYINTEHSDAAVKWYKGLKQAILTLEKHPNRCPLTPESAQVRHLLYGHKPHAYRVIYRVLEAQKHVEVLHIRHGRQHEFRTLELD